MVQIYKGDDGAEWMGVYDDGHDYHTVYAGAKPEMSDLLRHFGRIARGWKLESEYNLTAE